MTHDGIHAVENGARRPPPCCPGAATGMPAWPSGRRRSLVTARPVDGEDVYSVTIFANELSRDGMSVDLDGMDFSNYEKNPVVLYAHDHMGRTDSGGLPIGRTLRLARIRATDTSGRTSSFWRGTHSPSGCETPRNQGFLRGASIGWRPVETRPAGRGVRAVTVGTAGVVDSGGSCGPGRAAGRVSAGGEGDA